MHWVYEVTQFGFVRFGRNKLEIRTKTKTFHDPFFIEMYFSCTKKITTHCESYTTYGSLILFVIGVGKAIQFNAQEKLESVQIDPNLTQYADDTTVFV